MIQPVPFIGQPATLPLVAITTERQFRTRNGFDEESLRELASTIKEVGVIEPIIVRKSATDDGKYIVIAGERRLMASSLAGLAEVPVLVRDADADEAATVQAVENLQRVDLNLADTAECVAQLVKHHKTVGAVAKLLGKSKAWVSKHLSVARLGRTARELLEEGVTEDPEILLGMDKLSRTDAKAYGRLLNGLLAGSVGRDHVRGALAKVGATDAPEQQGDGPGVTGPAPKSLGKLELAEEPARLILSALMTVYGKSKTPAAEAILAHVAEFVSKTWPE